MQTQKRHFSKTLSETSNVLLIVITAAVLITGGCILFLSAFGWLADAGNVNAADMGVSPADEMFQILVDRSGENVYDAVEGGYPVYEGVSTLKEILNGKGYSTSASSTGEAALAFELVNENPNGVTLAALIPGSYGHLTFYIKPLSDSALNLSVAVSAVGYADAYDADNNAIVAVADSEAAQTLLQGHLLFFESRTENDSVLTYDGLLNDGAMAFSTEAAEKITDNTSDFYGCYEITLYWVWPETYGGILDGINRGQYPEALTEYITNNRACFFATDQDSTIYVELSDGYNDGDQTIGDNIDYVAAHVTVE